MQRFASLMAFAETAKRGNFAAASREMGCTPSTLAKSVSRLEQELGVRLFHRTTRQVTLTDDGVRLFERCQRVLGELELLRAEASGAREAPSGTLRISMPVTFGRVCMLPLLARYAQRYPEVAIDARFSDLYVDLVKESIDVAIRTGPLKDSGLVGRTFSSQQLLLFASPDYVSRCGMPRTIADLERHTGVLFRMPSTGKDRAWNFHAGHRNIAMTPPSRVRVDEGDAIVRACVAGMGIGQVPHYMVLDRLRSGEVVELLPEHRPAPMPISAVIPSARLVPARVRALVEMIVAKAEHFPAAPAVPRQRTKRRRGAG